MQSRPAHKRQASSRDSGPSKQPSTKKTRFVDPSEDPTNFAEEVDAALENPSSTRKGRVRTEGYESDSSDDGEGVVPSRRPGGGEAEEEEDMFVMGDKEEEKAEKSGKKEDKFLRLGDIEGQEFGGDEDEENEDEDEPEDEDDAEQRRKAGMGFELSSFNMREEMEEGKFSEDGMYVRTFDPHALHDRWMEDVDERAIKEARKRKRAQERAQRAKMRAEEKELEDLGGKESMEREMLPLLKKGETVLEALQRLGGQVKKSKTSGKSAKPSKSNGMSMIVDHSSNASDAISTIDRLTHLASTLMSLGDTDIYNKTYEELVRSVRSSGIVEASWEPPSADVKYEYRWDMPGSTGLGGEVFGPFSEEEMDAWFKASYFGTAGENVKVRRVGSEWGNWDDM